MSGTDPCTPAQPSRWIVGMARHSPAREAVLRNAGHSRFESGPYAALLFSDGCVALHETRTPEDIRPLRNETKEW